MAMVITKKSEVKIYDKVALATIDFAKNENTFYCRKCCGGPEMKKTVTFKHTLSDYDRIVDLAQKFAEKNCCTEIIFGFEPTGPYAIPFAHYLYRNGLKAVQVNPLHTKRAKEITDNSPNKTDNKDPKVIADIIELRRFMTVVLPLNTEADLRYLSNARERAQKRLTALYNQINDLVFQTFHEFFQVFRTIRTHTAQHLLINYLSPKSITALSLEEITTILRKKSRGRYGIKHAESLYTAACNSVGIQHGFASIAQEVTMLFNLVDKVNEQLKTIESQMKKCVTSIPYSKYILSIPRMNVITTGALIGEFADLPSFASANELLKFAGMDLYELSSGRFKGTKRISKRGRPLIRKWLYYAVLHMIGKNGMFNDAYKDRIRNKKHNAILGLLSRKLLRIIFALVNNKTEYNENYEIEKNKIAA
jgi:transposase